MPPAAPSGLSAVAGDGEVDVSWDANVEPDLAGSDLFRSTTSPVDTTGTPLNGATLLTATTFTDTTVVNGTEYFYTVVAVDNAGLVSPAATETSATPTVSACAAPVANDTVLCLESDSGGSDTAGVVSGWADQSTTGNDLTAAGNPTIGDVTTPSLMPSISFDGNGDVLERLATEGIGGLPAGSTDRTMFTVINYNGGNRYGGVAYGNKGQNKAFGLVVNGNKGFLTVQGYGSSHDVVSTEPGTGTGWLTQSAVVDSNVLTHYRDGTQIDLQSPRSYATEVDKIRIGQEIGGLGHVNIDVAVVLVYDRALSPTERQQVEDYLQTKYMTEVDVPPAAPSGLSAVPGDGEVDVAWDANVETDLAGYDLFRSTTSPVDTTGTPLNLSLIHISEPTRQLMSCRLPSWA